MSAVLKPEDIQIAVRDPHDGCELATFPLASRYRWRPYKEVHPRREEVARKTPLQHPTAEQIAKFPSRLRSVIASARHVIDPNPPRRDHRNPSEKWKKFFLEYDALPRSPRGRCVRGTLRDLCMKHHLNYLTATKRLADRRIEMESKNGMA